MDQNYSQMNMPQGMPAEQPPKKKKRKLKIFLIIIDVILLLVVAAGAYFVLRWDTVEDVTFQAAVERGEVAPNSDISEQTLERMKGYRTIAVFGVDARDMKTLDKGTQGDVNMIITINNETGEIRMVSVYRDSFVCTNDDLSRFAKLADNYAVNGAIGQVAVLNRNYDLNITDYVTVNWKAVATAIDALGGLDFEITSAELRNYNTYLDETAKSIGVSYEPIYEEGMHHFSGVQAVTYARLRNTAGDDYKRTERQRLVVSLLLEKAKSAGTKTLISLANTLFDDELIATSFTISDVLGMVDLVSKMSMSETEGFPFDKQSGGPPKYYVYPLGLKQNVTRLHELLYNNTEYTPSDTVLAIDQYIVDTSGYTAPSGS